MYVTMYVSCLGCLSCLGCPYAIRAVLYLIPRVRFDRALTSYRSDRTVAYVSCVQYSVFISSRISRFSAALP